MVKRPCSNHRLSISLFQVCHLTHSKASCNNKRANRYCKLKRASLQAASTSAYMCTYITSRIPCKWITKVPQIEFNCDSCQPALQMALPQLSPQLPGDKQAHQCSRRACRKAERPSMMRRMATVRTAKTAKMMKTPTSPPQPRLRRAMLITMVQSTSDSSVGARRMTSASAVPCTHLLNAHPSQPITSDAKVPPRAVQELVYLSFDHCDGAPNKKNQPNTQNHTL